LGGDGGAVGGGDRANDREAESVVAFGFGGPVAVEPLEWFEGRTTSWRGTAGPVLMIDSSEHGR
jgi:hypothetical protein